MAAASIRALTFRRRPAPSDHLRSNSIHQPSVTVLAASVSVFVACTASSPVFVSLMDAARRMREDRPVAKAPPLLPVVEQDSCLSQWLHLRCRLVLNPHSTGGKDEA
jgi:hypothetical protein